MNQFIFIILMFFSSISLTAETAIFAGGCFWCMEPPYDKIAGVISTTSGYSGGDKEGPTYKEVSSGNTGHREVIQIEFDPKSVSYEELLEVFWKNIDPLDAEGQFCDRGEQYKSAIYYKSEDQKKAAEISKKEIEKSLGKEVITDILPAKTFYPAEDEHQNYYKKNPIRYKFYRYTCGRDRRLKEVWGKD